MIKEKEIKIPSRKETIFEYFCDLCGTELEYDGTTKEKECCFDHDQAELYMAEGSRFPEGSSVEENRIDICSECMAKKIFPLLEKEFDLKPRKSYEG